MHPDTSLTCVRNFPYPSTGADGLAKPKDNKLVILRERIWSTTVWTRRRRRLAKWVLLTGCVAGAAAIAVVLLPDLILARGSSAPERARPRVGETARFQPNDAQWASLTIEAPMPRTFRSVLATDGKIAVDEDHATPVFSPYTGRIMRLFARAGDRIEQGQPLFTIEAADMVQGQNDFLNALTGMHKAKAQERVTEIAYKRHKELLQFNAVAKRDYEQAEAAFITAQNDAKSAEAVLQAARNRLRILGKSDA